MKNIKYSKTKAFINRKKELQFLQNWLNNESENILFLHGPKSSGKTTLLYKFMEKFIDRDKVNVKFLNLREILIVNYQDFIKTFFEIDFSKSKKEDVKEKREYNLGVFKLSVEVLKDLQTKSLDPFKVMKREIVKLNKSGIKVMIIIDELQAIDGIYMNSQRELLKELFNFFVAMTKESHICHIMISSSDGYFLEKIYQDSKLNKCAKFFEVDYLQKNDVVYWLNNLEKESGIENLLLTEGQIEKIWDYFGGSVWEISDFLSDLMLITNDKKIDDIELINEAEKRIHRYRSNFYERAILDTPKTELYKVLNNILHNKESFEIGDFSKLINDKLWNKDDLTKELIDLVRNNMMVYNPTKASYYPQGRSTLLGLQKFCKEL